MGQLEFDGGTEVIIPFIVGVESRHKNHHPFISDYFFFFRIIQISFTKGIWILVSISIEFQLLPAPSTIPNHWHQYSKTDLHFAVGTSTFVSKKQQKQPCPLLYDWWKKTSSINPHHSFLRLRGFAKRSLEHSTEDEVLQRWGRRIRIIGVFEKTRFLRIPKKLKKIEASGMILNL